MNILHSNYCLQLYNNRIPVIYFFYNKLMWWKWQYRHGPWACQPIWLIYLLILVADVFRHLCPIISWFYFPEAIKSAFHQNQKYVIQLLYFLHNTTNLVVSSVAETKHKFFDQPYSINLLKNELHQHDWLCWKIQHWFFKGELWTIINSWVILCLHVVIQHYTTRE